MIIAQKDNYIITFSRDSNGNRIIDRCGDFQPYFYVGKDEEIPKDSRIIDIKLADKKSLFGEEVKKITVKNPYDVSNLRIQFYRHYEADIPYVWRYYIDRVKEIPTERLRKLYLDIETADMPSTELNNQPITCIGFWDNYEEKYTTVILDKEDPTYRIVERERHTLYYCPTEYVLLSKFIDVVRELDPDMLIAHNGDRFDFPVIVGRLMALSVMGYGRLSPLGSVKRDNAFGEWKTTCAGRILFDFMGAKTNFGVKGGIRGLLDGRDITVKGKDGEDRIIRIKRWSLAYLAQFVGMEKGEYSKIETLDEMVKYNTQDIKIMVELDKFFNVTEYYHNMQILIGCPYEATYFNTLMIDNFLLKRYSQYVFPTKPVRGKFDNDETIKGADVGEPIQGLYKKINVVDQTSLYPSLIVSFNMSPETVDPDGDIVVGNGVRFTSSKIGIIPDAVKFLLDIRLKYKKLAKTEPDAYTAQMYDLLSNGYKTLLVSFYGALLFKGFRLYQHDVAESIPYGGRVIKVQHVKPICEKNGYEIIASDTDSAFLNPVRSDATEINLLVDIINKSYDQFAADHGIKNHIFKIELDKVYSPLLMSDVKKRYCGYLVKGDKNIYKSVGFESVRRDVSPIFETLQEDIFKMILGNKKRKDIDTLVESIKQNLLENKIPLYMLMLPKGFSQSFSSYKTKNPWVTGVQYSNENLGTHFDRYSEIGIFYIKHVPENKPFTDVIAVDTESINILDGFTIDFKTQFEKAIDTKVERIYKIMNWEATKQKSLLEF